jgi:hypothetical protein
MGVYQATGEKVRYLHAPDAMEGSRVRFTLPLRPRYTSLTAARHPASTITQSAGPGSRYRVISLWNPVRGAGQVWP